MVLQLQFCTAIGPATGARLKLAGRNAGLSLNRIELLGQSRRVALDFIDAERQHRVDAFLIRVDWECLEYLARAPKVPVYPTPESFNAERGTDAPVSEMIETPGQYANAKATAPREFDWSPKVAPRVRPATPRLAIKPMLVAPVAEWDCIVTTAPETRTLVPSARRTQHANTA
jgi:hypothetical protein